MLTQPNSTGGTTLSTARLFIEGALKLRMWLLSKLKACTLLVICHNSWETIAYVEVWLPEWSKNNYTHLKHQQFDAVQQVDFKAMVHAT